MVIEPRRPFLDYYRAHEISPVSQDIGDLTLHIERRTSLYRALGIAPRFLEGRTALEFGPGSGHNAIATSALRPRRYVLVDGNPTGLARARALLDRHAPDPAACVLVESLIENFATDERFDLVIGEGMIPLQLDPPSFARHIASFVAPGGVLVFTTQDAATCLADLVRRLVAASLLPPGLEVEAQVERLRPLFADHLSTLAGVSRPVDDWILDQITHPFIGEMFGIDDALGTLEGIGLEPYHASPAFFTVWRWYKTQVGPARSIADDVRYGYYDSLASLVDIRLGGRVRHGVDFGKALLRECDGFFSELKRAERKTHDFTTAERALHRIADMLRSCAPLTAQSLDEALELCDAARRGLPSPATPALRAFWGHGQQYMSFVAR